MKKATVGLIGTLLVITFTSSAWAHPQSGLRIDLGGNGLGFSLYNGYQGYSPYWNNNYRPYPYNSYSRYYPNRPYMGWGGYRGHHRHNHNHWGQHRSGHYNKGRSYRNQRKYNRGDYGQNRGNHRRHNHNGRQWRR